MHPERCIHVLCRRIQRSNSTWAIVHDLSRGTQNKKGCIMLHFRALVTRDTCCDIEKGERTNVDAEFGAVGQKFSEIKRLRGPRNKLKRISDQCRINCWSVEHWFRPIIADNAGKRLLAQLQPTTMSIRMSWRAQTTTWRCISWTCQVT